jgi:hypothetical protein
MKFHACLKAERIGEAIRRNLPALGQKGLDASVPVDAHETFIEIGPSHFADGDRRRDGGIEPRGLDGHADDEGRLRGMGRNEADGKEKGGGQNALRH